MRKGFVLLLVLTLTLVSLIIVESAFAQSISKPSVPTFTAKYIDYTSYLAPTYTINPYTGQNETTSSGSLVSNPTIEFTIKNQPFSPYYDSRGNYIDLYYNFRDKGHYGNDWTYYPFYVFNNNVTGQSEIQTTHSYGAYSGGFFIYYNASESNYTTIVLDEHQLGIPSAGQVDLQVQAQIGHIDDIASGLLAGDFYSFTGESSNWSNTQTLSINYNSNSTGFASTPNPTASTIPGPTLTPTIPEFSWLVILPLLLSILSIAIMLKLRNRE